MGYNYLHRKRRQSRNYILLIVWLELYIKALYQNQERFVDFTLTYIRERKELHI